MSIYQVDIKMGEEKLIKAFSKLINSDVLKSIYPMLDHIDIDRVNDNPNFIGYDMSVNIFLNDLLSIIEKTDICNFADDNSL